MQTFLPYPDFHETARVLDDRRLGRQRVEAYQILRVLAGMTRGWVNHPAVKMWKGYEWALKKYHNTMITEWVNRGYNNTMKKFYVNEDKVELPPFIGQKSFHASHRSNLLRKDAEYYGQFGWQEPDDLPYVWG